MDSNTYDFETMRQIEILTKELGTISECKRLGFVFEDDRSIIRLSVSGLGYLLFVNASEVKNPAEAFAAGYQCAGYEIENR